ncbi:fibronectin type III domain-containing protein [Flagellimonas onchidii]|uniref:fibronectin type III domain-containing protein n=1 Tax=Flagellimonas onchidii TaxID=2562684 RepID=UPI00197A90B9|nr:hypothetical protein [Allomuricauda onchidii]
MCFVVAQKSTAQQGETDADGPQIVVMARPKKDGEIMLRWAVTTPLAWRKLNIYGYALTRYTITRNNSTILEPIEKFIGVFKPKPLQEWMPIIEDNDNAAVLAQSIYGEGFEVEGLDQLSTIINLAEEQEQRFTWGLYAADQDFIAAQMAGLAYVDRSAQANEKYVYKVSSLVPESEMIIKEGGVFIGLKDYEPLPKPLDLAVVFLDGKAMLSWNYDIHHQIYNSYYVERSKDSINFTALSDLPLTSLNNGDKTDAKRMFYVDSIANGTTYYYRIKGKTPFSEIGPTSAIISGKGEKNLEYVPHITTKYFLDDTKVILEWEFLKEGNQYIKGFELNSSDKAGGPYKVVVKDIPPEARKIQYDSLQPTNYMTITAVGKHGGNRTSFPALVQPVDSIPPLKPNGFSGTIDSLGVVTLTWNQNKDKDILGYRIFRGNLKNEEYSQITVSPHRGTTFYDSVSVKNLNPKVFYQLIAVDQRFNMSEPSDILEIKKPDYIRPTQPVFKSYHIKDGKVYMEWANSSSDDVIRHKIYRKATENSDWILVHSVGTGQPSISPLQTEILPTAILPTAHWTDKEVEENQKYSYTIVAVDDSNLESDPAPPLTIIVPKTSMPPSVKGLNAYIDRENKSIELYWSAYKHNNVDKLIIYKGIKDKSMTQLAHVLPGIKRLVDKNINPNNTYVYMIRAVYKDGSLSKTAQLDIKY